MCGEVGAAGSVSAKGLAIPGPQAASIPACFVDEHAVAAADSPSSQLQQQRQQEQQQREQQRQQQQQQQQQQQHHQQEQPNPKNTKPTWPLPLPKTMPCKECRQVKDTRKGFSQRQVRTILQALRRLPPDATVDDLSISVVCTRCGQQLKDEENKTPLGVAVDGLTGVPKPQEQVQSSYNEVYMPPLTSARDAAAVTAEHAATQSEMLATAPTPIQEATPPCSSAATTTTTSSSTPSLWVTNPEVLPIPGLRYYPNFLTEAEEHRILEIIDRHPWSQAVRRRQQFYGQVYYHTTRENSALQPKFENSNFADEGAGGPPTSSSLGSPSSPSRVSAFRLDEFDFLIDKFYDPLFVDGTVPDNEVFGKDRSSFPTQILVNEYIDALGIASHFEDEEAFGDVIATISLLQPIYMSLERPRERTNDCDDLLADTKALLEARSLFIMAEDARFLWRHGITRHIKVHVPQCGAPGKFHAVRRDDPSYRRISLTIRHLKDGRRQAQQPE